jgi:hypothetical protein
VFNESCWPTSNPGFLKVVTIVDKEDATESTIQAQTTLIAI